MKPIDYTYHSHTYRCGHATGEDEAYVKEAIKKGFQVYGFSEHVILPDRSQPGMRGEPEMAEEYFASVRSLQKKYEKDIEILLGFECEWYGGKHREYYEKLKAEKVDYLILGQHCCLQDEEFVFYLHMEDKAKAVELYCEAVEEAMASGLFAYVAHPDYHYYIWREDNEIQQKVTRRICESAVKYGVPLEINMCMWHWKKFVGRTDYDYPNDAFWKIAQEYPIEVIFGLDAHDPSHIADTPYDFYQKFASKYRLNIINRLPIHKRF